jgi:hypothetical protein
VEKAVCPSLPVLVNVAGDYNGESNYDAAVGNHKCPSYYLGAMSADGATPLQVILLSPTPGAQAQEIPYERDFSVFIMVSDKMSPSEFMKWLKEKANMDFVLETAHVPNVKQVQLSGFGEADKTYDLATFVTQPPA